MVIQSHLQRLVGAWGLQTARDGLTGDRSAVGAMIDFPNDCWDISTSFRRAGDGWLQREGYTLVWFGWQADVLPGGGRMTFSAPAARNRDGRALVFERRTTTFGEFDTRADRVAHALVDAGVATGDRIVYLGKNSDTFCPMGPLITTGVDPMQSTTRVMKNGVLAAEFATGDMLFDAADYIVATARYITFHPGDVIWLGSDGNVEMAPGDTIEISIDGVGSLRNTVVEESPG